ncbi:MAG: hypothetical protein NC826_01365 [Candidatus Omnitrophica bacterium]|nr:hypothetical protein [Candidatus Omnitrophota bacterium]
MNENILKNLDVLSLFKEYGVLKQSAGNFRCRKCLVTDGYKENEKRCRWCGGQLFEMDKL